MLTKHVLPAQFNRTRQTGFFLNAVHKLCLILTCTLLVQTVQDAIMKKQTQESKPQIAYYYCLAYVIIDFLKQAFPSPLEDNAELTSAIKYELETTDREQIYWLWHDLLDCLELMAPYEQEWLDEPDAKKELQHIMKAIVDPDDFSKKCFYYMGLLLHGIDEVDGEKN